MARFPKHARVNMAGINKKILFQHFPMSNKAESIGFEEIAQSIMKHKEDVTGSLELEEILMMPIADTLKQASAYPESKLT